MRPYRSDGRGLRRKVYKLVSIFAVMCTVTPVVWAQGAAQVSGVVFTATAEYSRTLWPGARVTLRNGQAGVTHVATSNTMGEFRFDALQAGEYHMTVALEGYETEERSVTVEPGAAVRVDVGLRLAGVDAEVDVASPAPEVADPMARVPEAITYGLLRTLPLVEEQYQNALPLLPAVLRGPDGRFNLSGAASEQSGALVAGSSVVDPVTGEMAMSLPFEAAGAIRVVRNPSSVAYGRVTGAAVEVETPQGGDTWHFGLRGIVPRFRYSGGIQGLEAATPRFTFSGPLVAGRAWVFQALDYRYVQTEIESRPALPEGQDETGLDAFDSFTRVDVKLDEQNWLTAMVEVYLQNLEHVGLDTFNPQTASPNFRQRGYWVAVSERGSFYDGSFLDSSFSVKRYDAHVWPSTPDAALVAGLFLFPDQNFGRWNSVQDRESIFYQWRQDLHLRPLRGAGTHRLQMGYRFAHAEYDGRVANFPVTVVRGDGTTSQRIDFLQPERQERESEDLGFYVQDRWQWNPRFALDVGVRMDRESHSGDDLNVAPRGAVSIALTPDFKTMVRLSGGVYYGKLPLHLGTFSDCPVQILTRFAADGVTVVDGPKAFSYVLATRDGRLHVPRSVVWSAHIERELGRRAAVRLGYQRRDTYNEFVVDPVESFAPAVAEFRLRNTGGARYEEYEAMLRWHATERTSLFFSYLASQNRGDLNDFGLFFGNYPTAIIRANQRGRLGWDAPHRFLAWGTVGLPWKLELLPVIEARSGFPFSAVDDDLNFVGARNRAGRYPTYFTLDFQLTRRFVIPFAGRKWNVLAGVRWFNVTDRFNPRDVQQVVTHPEFGRFFSSFERTLRLRFEIQL
jgi:hypothetical protein